MGTDIKALRQNAHLPAKDMGAKNVAQYFAAHEKQIISVLPAFMDSKRMLRIAVNAISNTPRLADCTVESLLGAVIQSSIMGLEPNTPLGQAYLVPFRNTKKNVMEVQFIMGYKGLIDLARRSGQIESINAHEIYSNDEFEFSYGLEETLVHKPTWEADRGNFVGAYAVAKFKDGGHIFEVMSKAQIESIRDNSQGYRAAKQYKFSSPWMTSFDEMARKTCIRRISKYLPMSIEMQNAVTLDNTSDKGQPQELADVLTGDYQVVETSDQAIEEEKQAQIEAQGWFESAVGEKVNAHGEIWNPEIHATGRDSHGPIINKSDGSFRAKRGVQKAIEDKSKPEEPAETEKVEEKEPVKAEVKEEQAAVVVADKPADPEPEEAEEEEEEWEEEAEEASDDANAPIGLD